MKTNNNIEKINEQLQNGGLRGFVKCQIKPWVEFYKSECKNDINPSEVLKQIMDKYCPEWRKLSIIELVPVFEAIDVILFQELGISVNNQSKTYGSSETVGKRKPGRLRKNQ